MKRILALSVCSLFFLAFFTLPAYAVTTQLYVDPNPRTVGKVGKIFTIDVDVFWVANLYGFEFKLSYNTTLLDAKSITLGSFFPGSPTKSYVLKNQINDTGGYVWLAVTLLAPEPAKSGNGILATITFNATYGTIYPQTAGCTLHLYDTALSDPAAQPIAHVTADGQYSFTPIQGDINGDGTVDLFDIVIVAAEFGHGQVGNPPIVDTRADLNNDGIVNIFDAVLLAANFGKTG